MARVLKKHYAGWILAGSFVLSGCFNREQTEEEPQPNPEIREQITQAGAVMQDALSYDVRIDTSLDSETRRDGVYQLALSAQMDGSVDNQSQQFALSGNFELENRSDESYLFVMNEPETFSNGFYINDFYRYEPAPGETVAREFQVQGVKTEELEETIWTDYGEDAEYAVFHDLIDGRMRYYINEEKDQHYSNRVQLSLEAIASHAQELETSEETGVTEITGLLEENQAAFFDLFWIDPYRYLADSYRKPLRFSLMLNSETLLPLQLMFETAEVEEPALNLEKDRPLEQEGQHVITFYNHNQAAVAGAVLTAEETHYAPNGLFHSDTFSAMKQISDRFLKSKKPDGTAGKSSCSNPL